jgi:hypothetical protein
MAGVAGFDPKVHGFHFANSFGGFDLTLPILGKVRAPTYGLCGGMAFGVRDLWEAGLLPPATSSPPAERTPQWSYLCRRLVDSLPVGTVSRYITLSSATLADHDRWFTHGRSWIMIKREWPRVRADLDAGRLCPLGLIKVVSLNPLDVTNDHQVCAYSYDLDGTTLRIHLYEPNYPGRTVRMSLDLGRPKKATPIAYEEQRPDGSWRDTGRTVHMFFRADSYSWTSPAAIAARPAAAAAV